MLLALLEGLSEGVVSFKVLNGASVCLAGRFRPIPAAAQGALVPSPTLGAGVAPAAQGALVPCPDSRFIFVFVAHGAFVRFAVGASLFWDILVPDARSG